MTRSSYGRFSDTVQISGISMNVHQKGIVRYVCNASTVASSGVAGSDNNDGKTPDRPFATIAHALSVCVANRGDKIILLPGHAETVSAAGGIALNVQGVSIIGDPNAVGSQRPTITLGTANTATVTVTAPEIVIQNVLFVANFLNIATCLDIAAATDVQVVNCEFRDTSASLNFVKAIRTNTTANAADGLFVSNNRYLGLGTSATTSFIQCQAAINRMTVVENDVNIQGTTSTTGTLILATSHALTGAQILRNNVQSPITTSAAGGLIVAGSGGNGMIRDNYLYVAAASSAILITTGAGLGECNNYVSRSAVDTSGLLLPAASS